MKPVGTGRTRARLGSVAVRNLLAEPTRLALSVLGVAFAVLLVLVMSGIFTGTTRGVTTYIDHTRAPVWAMQPGVTQMFRAVSWLPADDAQRLTALPEVAAAAPILGQPSDFVHNGEQTAYFVVGYDTGADTGPDTGAPASGDNGGPWSLAEGRTVEAPGEVVLDQVLARKNGIGLGETVEIIDTGFTVVGLSAQTAALGNYYAFVSLSDAAALMRAGDRVSYFLVTPAPGHTPAQTAAAINQNLPGISALTATTFAENNRAIIVSMIGRPLKTMIAIAVLVGIALIGLTMWALTAEQHHDFGVLRALGVRPAQLARTVAAQAALVATLGYLLGAATAYTAQFLIGDRLGDVTIAVTPTMLAAMAAATAAMATLGSLLPLRRVLTIDPATAFRR